MCDQTEVIYAPGDVVWVKLGPVWWPSQVQDYDKLSADITANLRKRPIAVVKFFQEDAFEYVKNLDQIYHYNCRKKHEFIKKGLDMCRSSNRNVPSNMKMFPNDIATAEHLTHGDPNILDDPEFQPEEKEDYRELFGKKPAKKSRLDHGEQKWRIRSLGESAFKSTAKNGRQSLQLTPRAVTHPRFINKALGRGSDHEVRIRSQSNDVLQSSGKLYNCHLCGFSASRINVIILHNKSHSAGYADAFLPSTPSGNKSKKRSVNEKRPKTSSVIDKTKSDEPPVKRKTIGGSAENKMQIQPSNKSQKESKDATPGSPSKTGSSPSPARKPIFGKKRSAKDKAEKAAKEKRQTDEFRENLLKDWDDDEDNGSTENKSDSVAKSADDDNKGDAEDKTKTDDSKKTPTKETSCFDFDDSEDGIKPEETIMQFGRKIPRLLGDKRKRKSDSEDLDDKEAAIEPKEIEVSSEDKPMTELCNEEESIEERKSREEKEENERKAKEEFDMAFKTLLEETVAPTIPDAFECNRDKDAHSLGEATLNTSSLVDDGIVPPDPPEENELIKSDVADVVEEVECVSTEDNQHFLVKTSGEGATTSPDKEISETKITFCDSNNVAHSPAENFEQSKELVAHVEEIVEQTTIIEEVVDFKVDETVVKTDEECNKSLLPEEHPADSSKCQGFLSNDFVDDCIVDNYCSVEQSAQSHQSSPKTNKTPQLNNETNLIKTAKRPKKIANESKSAGLTQGGDMQFIVVTSNANETNNVATSMSNTPLSVKSLYQDMDFDIDSMPVIIGDDMTQEEQGQGPVFQAVETTVVPQKVQKNQPLLSMLSSKGSSKVVENKVVTVISSSGQLSKINQSELKQVKKPAIIKKDQSAQPTMVRIPTTIDNKITRKVILTPSKKLNSPSTAVRIAAASSSQVGKLSVPGLVTQKGIVQNAAGSGQVLILKSAGPSGTASKATLQKMPQMIQPAGGNKVLILTSTSGASGQKVLGTLASPQKTITGTRFLTTTKGSVVVGKGGGNTCQKILIDKSGAISQAPKSVIIDKGGISIGSALSKNSTALLTSSSDSIATLGSKLTLTGNSKAATTILASSSVSGKKGVILTPISGKGATVADNQKFRLLASKSSSSVSSTTGAKLVISSPQSRILVPSVATKNQQLKLLTSAKAQPNSSNTILIQSNQGVLATSSFSGAVQNRTVISSKPQATLVAAPKARILHGQNMFQAQNKKLVVPKKLASPNILQKTQKTSVQRMTKKNFVTEQTALLTSPSPSPVAATATATAPATQDVLLLPSMKNMPIVSQGTILQGTTVDSEGRKSYVYLTVDEHGNYRPLETAPVLDFNVASTSEQVQSEPQVQQQQTSSQSQLPVAAEETTVPTSTSSSTQQAQLPPQQTLYFDPGTTDLDSLLLAIDEAGNVVNISQQQQQPTVAVPQVKTAGGSTVEHCGQDILAKALADTQVLQQESTAIASDPVTSSMLGCVFVDSLPPAPSLAHNVLETSTTLNQTPIMTPLEMPSAVSSLQTNILPQIQSDFLKNSTLVDPSMPLLSEDSTDVSSTAAKSNKTIFVSTSDSAAMLEQNGSPPLAFQLSIGTDNNIIVSSASNISSSLAAYLTTHPSTSATQTILSQTSADSVAYAHATVEEQPPSVVEVEQAFTTTAVEQQVVTDGAAEVYPGVTFDMKTMDSASIPVSLSAIDYQESSSAPSMEAKTDYDDDGSAFNVEETSTMSVASSDYDLSISDSTKTVTIEEQSTSTSDHVQKLTFGSDKQR